MIPDLAIMAGLVVCLAVVSAFLIRNAPKTMRNFQDFSAITHKLIEENERNLALMEQSTTLRGEWLALQQENNRLLAELVDVLRAKSR